MIISTALQIPNAIFTESFLSFLGLGVNAPMPSLGSLASDALNGIYSYTYRLIIPAVVICLIVLIHRRRSQRLVDVLAGLKEKV